MSYQKIHVIKPKRFSTYYYIENEFFNADRETLRKITDLYYDLYGYGPHKYLIDTYHSWKSGYVSTSGQTMSRIIECVPRFLSDEKRFLILKNEMINFIENLNNKRSYKTFNINEINEIFIQYLIEIENFNETNLPYLVGKKIFTSDEIEQFLMICKYTLIEKLNLAYRQVNNDLKLIKSKLSVIKTGIFKANYQIDLLNAKIDLSSINKKEITFEKLKHLKINPDDKYKIFAEKYILEEFLQMSFIEKDGFKNHHIKSKDLDLFLNQYYEINKTKNEATLKSEFKGEGGFLNLIIDVKSIKKIKISIFYSLIKISVYLLVPLFIFRFFDFFKIFIFLIIGGALIAYYLLEKLFEEVSTVYKLKKQLRIYGKH